MRRKSSSKGSTEKSDEARKSRRHSRRRRKSSSYSSSEDSDINCATVSKTMEVQEPKKVESEVEESSRKELFTPSKETQKSDKTERSSKRRYSKSSKQTSEDFGTPDEKVSTKSSGLTCTNVEDEEEESDEQEDKSGKGKSKTKHNSKSEKSPHTQDIEDQIHSEISENVQVTPQSPQAAIDIRVDNESVSTIECEHVATDETETSILQKSNAVDSCEDVISRSTNAEKSIKGRECHTPPMAKIVDVIGVRDVQNLKGLNPENDDAAKKQNLYIKEVSSDVSENLRKAQTTEGTTDESVHKITKILVGNLEVPEEADNINKNAEEHLQDKNITDSDENREHFPKSLLSSNQAPAVDNLESGNSMKENDNCYVEKEKNCKQKLNSEDVSITDVEIAEPNRSDEDSHSMDVSLDHNSMTNTENTSFNLTQSFSPVVKELVTENIRLQNLKSEVCDLFHISSEVEQNCKWGNSLLSLELMKPSLYKIDINTIKNLVPEVKFLDENEIRLDVHERRKSYTFETKEKRMDRKVSIEGKSDDGDYRRLDTQISLNPSEIEEVIEMEVDNSNIIAMNRKISIVDDTASKLRPPPSPPRHPISEVLYITNLVRPFTLKQLKELLERTGKIKENGFWTDRIKSKCYVNYETVEESVATRNALHGVNWPIGNGKKLIIDYATESDLEKARNPEPPTPPLVPAVTAPIVVEPKISENKSQENELLLKRNKPENYEKTARERDRYRNEGHVREWDIGKENMQKQHSHSKEHEERSSKNNRRRHRTPSPVNDFINKKQRKKDDIPQKLMDDLFRKTKSTPSIYWLPLTPEEIATKQQQRLLRMAEHKRRMEESSRSRGDYGRGAPYRRRYD